MDTVTHIAGPTITACGRHIQRCSLCGEKLCDSKGQMAPLNSDGSPPTFPSWETGRLVRVTAGNPTHFKLLPDTDRLPTDSCIHLLE
jgi:hypothetical protein